MSKNSVCPKWCSECTHGAKIRMKHKVKPVCTVGCKRPLFGLSRFCKSPKKAKR